MARDGVVNKASAGPEGHAAHRARAGRTVGLHPRGPSYGNSVAFDVTAAFWFVLLEIIKLKLICSAATLQMSS